MREGLNIHNSEWLNNSFEEYRNSPEYKIEVSQRIETLKSLWVFDKFAEALAKDSVKNKFTVEELLRKDIQEQIIDENDKLKSRFTELEKNKVNMIINWSNDANYRNSANDDNYRDAA